MADYCLDIKYKLKNYKIQLENDENYTVKSLVEELKGLFQEKYLFLSTSNKRILSDAFKIIKGINNSKESDSLLCLNAYSTLFDYERENIESNGPIINTQVNYKQKPLDYDEDKKISNMKIDRYNIEENNEKNKEKEKDNITIDDKSSSHYIRNKSSTGNDIEIQSNNNLTDLYSKYQKPSIDIYKQYSKEGMNEDYLNKPKEYNIDYSKESIINNKFSESPKKSESSNMYSNTNQDYSQKFNYEKNDKQPHDYSMMSKTPIQNYKINNEETNDQLNKDYLSKYKYGSGINFVSKTPNKYGASQTTRNNYNENEKETYKAPSANNDKENNAKLEYEQFKFTGSILNNSNLPKQRSENNEINQEKEAAQAVEYNFKRFNPSSQSAIGIKPQEDNKKFYSMNNFSNYSNNHLENKKPIENQEIKDYDIKNRLNQIRSQVQTDSQIKKQINTENSETADKLPKRKF